MRNISSHRGRKKKKNFNRGGEETRVVNSVGRVDRELFVRSDFCRGGGAKRRFGRLPMKPVRLQLFD